MIDLAILAAIAFLACLWCAAIGLLSIAYCTAWCVAWAWGWLRRAVAYVGAVQRVVEPEGWTS